METLPVEMVERIVQQLTPQDLARCSAVCREWREIFNQDCMWKPHCDPELEEPLRTIPCVATPAFVAPEADNSTLPPICHWKLAFMRESHLWKNWSGKELMDKNEIVTKFHNVGNRFMGVDFLTDTLVVVWRENSIEIFDVSVVPTAFVAKTDTSILGNCLSRRVIGPTMLLVEKIFSIRVFNVSISNKTIELQHSIRLTHGHPSAIVAKEHVCLCLDIEGSKFKIFDLNTGKLLKEERCPIKTTQNQNVNFNKLKVSRSNDFVACQVFVQDNCNGKEYYKYYIYSVEQLAFLPGPVAEYEYDLTDRFKDLHNYFALLDHWLATTNYKTLRVHNFQTRDVLLNRERSSKGFIPGEIEACNDCFVFVDLPQDGSKLSIYFYFPSNRSLITLCDTSSVLGFRVFFNKFISLEIHDQNSYSYNAYEWLKLSGQTVEKFDLSVNFHFIHRSFTKVLNCNLLKNTVDIKYLW